MAIKKFGIKYLPTNEWVRCSNADEDYLFTADKTKIKAALADILYSSDNDHSGDEKDFDIQSIDLPEDYNGSNLLKDEDDVFFIDPQIVDANLVMKDVFKEYGLDKK